MHIVVLCATNRGYRFLERLLQLGSGHQFTVFSFREEPWEPAYLDDIQALAQRHNATFYESRNVNHAKWNSFWETTHIDLMFMVSWRYLVPSSIYTLPQLGAYVFHDSLLPTYRGFEPTVWAMINGESQTGVTLFKVVDEVDAGDILDQQAVPITPTDTIADVVEKVTQAYLALISKNFEQLISGQAQLTPQNHDQATFTCKWTPDDARIDWSQSSQTIYNLIRATTYPYPGAFCYLDGEKLTIWSAELQETPRDYVARVHGRVAEIHRESGVVILTGDSTLLLKDVQLDGGAIVNAATLIKSPSKTLTSYPN
jgi:methionyl-tRNA formyltransferase